MLGSCQPPGKPDRNRIIDVIAMEVSIRMCSFLASCKEVTLMRGSVDLAGIQYSLRPVLMTNLGGLLERGVFDTGGL